MDNPIILDLYNGEISCTASSARVLTETNFFYNMKCAVSITIWFLAAFSFMEYVQINFLFFKK